MSYVNTIGFIVQDVQHLPNGVNQILDHLYLGNFEDARDIENLKSLGMFSLFIFGFFFFLIKK